jgi:hypothetical protein
MNDGTPAYGDDDGRRLQQQSRLLCEQAAHLGTISQALRATSAALRRANQQRRFDAEQRLARAQSAHVYPCFCPRICRR